MTFNQLRIKALFVRAKGIEPIRLSAPDPKSGLSTNFNTPANVYLHSFRNGLQRYYIFSILQKAHAINHIASGPWPCGSEIICKGDSSSILSSAAPVHEKDSHKRKGYDGHRGTYRKIYSEIDIFDHHICYKQQTDSQQG